MHRGRRGEGLGLLFLGSQLFSFGFDRIPPVTLVTIILQAAVYLGFFPAFSPSHTYAYCLNASRVWWGREWWRLLPSQFMHADDMHLYYNMASFLWKGRRLERRFGSGYFAALIVYLAALTSVTMVGLAYGLEELAEIRGWGLMNQCAVGFSGILFALKVIVNHEFPQGDEMIMGWLPVSSKWACWAELGIIQLLVPHASFLGHLAGILAGLAFLHTPLRTVLHTIITPEWSAVRTERRSTSSRGRTYGSGTWGQGGQGGESWSRYTGGLSEDEQLRRAMAESATARQQHRPYVRPEPSAPPLYPDLDQMNHRY